MNVFKIVFQRYSTRKKQRNKQNAVNRKAESELLTDEDVMSAILMLPGPVCTLRALNQSAPKKYRHLIRAKHYRKAAFVLQDAKFGFIKLLTHGGPKAKFPIMVFIKKPPEEVQQLKAKLQEICNQEEYAMERYTMQFSRRPPACIVEFYQKKLILLGLVPEKHFKLAYD